MYKYKYPNKIKYTTKLIIYVKVKMGTQAEMDDAAEVYGRITMLPSSDSERASTRSSRRMSLAHLVRHHKPTMEAVRKSEFSRSQVSTGLSELDNLENYDLLLQRLEEVFQRDHPYSSVRYVDLYHLSTY